MPLFGAVTQTTYHNNKSSVLSETKQKIKQKVKFSCNMPCRHKEGVDVQLYYFLSSALHEGEWIIFVNNQLDA